MPLFSQLLVAFVSGICCPWTKHLVHPPLGVRKLPPELTIILVHLYPRLLCCHFQTFDAVRPMMVMFDVLVHAVAALAFAVRPGIAQKIDERISVLAFPLQVL